MPTKPRAPKSTKAAEPFTPETFQQFVDILATPGRHSIVYREEIERLVVAAQRWLEAKRLLAEAQARLADMERRQAAYAGIVETAMGRCGLSFNQPADFEHRLCAVLAYATAAAAEKK